MPFTTLNELFDTLQEVPSAECFSVVRESDQSLIGSLTTKHLLFGSHSVATHGANAGIGAGDRVMLVAPTSVSWVQAFVGILRSGAVAVPTNHMFTEYELLPILDLVRPRALIIDDSTQAQVEAAITRFRDDVQVYQLDQLLGTEPNQAMVRRVSPDDPAVILFTSGTTGSPKGVVKRHGEYAKFIAWFAQFAMSEEDRLANFLPMYHQAGLVLTFLAGLARQVPTVHIDRYRPETFWDNIDAHQLTWSIMMQPMPRQLLSRPVSHEDSTHSLRWAFGTAGPGDWIEFQRRFQVSFQSSYGSTETTVACLTGTRNDPTVRSERIRGPKGGALCGRPSDSWAEIRLSSPEKAALDTERSGYLEVRGPAIFREYFHNASKTREAFTSDGWFRTGDYGYYSTTGELYLLDRSGDLIRRSGETIAPREVEEVLLALDHIVDCAVVGVADETREHEVAAFIQRKIGSNVTAQAIFEHCGVRLARFKIPRYIEFVDSLPRTNTHKVQKGQLKLSRKAVDRNAALESQS